MLRSPVESVPKESNNDPQTVQGFRWIILCGFPQRVQTAGATRLPHRVQMARKSRRLEWRSELIKRRSTPSTGAGLERRLIAPREGRPAWSWSVYRPAPRGQAGTCTAPMANVSTRNRASCTRSSSQVLRLRPNERSRPAFSVTLHRLRNIPPPHARRGGPTSSSQGVPLGSKPKSLPHRLHVPASVSARGASLTPGSGLY
jgi:hypothetical protein